ncbi:MAG: ATP-binding protein [Arenicellales bacterium]
MARRTYSLRWRIVRLVGIPVVLSGLLVGAFALYSSWKEVREVYDTQLIHSAKILHQLTEHELSENEDKTINLIPETEDLGYKYERNIAFRIWHDGSPITRSVNAPPFGLLKAPPGFSNQRVSGEKWRFFVYSDPDSGITVETSERFEIRYELVWYLLLGLLLPGSLFIPVALVIVWLGTSRGLRPLAFLSRDVDTRDSDDLSSIEPERTPREIDALINALNRLFGRLKEALNRERDFTDNAAHELRTPLAAIKTQAQALRSRLQGASRHDEAFANLLSSIDRATSLVDKMLAFSRLQKESCRPTPVDLPSLLGETIADMAGDAVAKRHELTLEADEPTTIYGDRDALGIMVRNLVENAIKYTPPGGRISVGLTKLGSRPSILVQDTGPGIADAEKGRVLNRFYRIAGADSPGGGLGLAIVKWIADQHRADLSLSDVEPNGLRCTVTFQGA